jgi:hypothetical protein
MFGRSVAMRSGLAAFVFCGAVLALSAPAGAGASTGTWRNGMQAGPYGPGYYGPDGSYYGPPRYYGGRRGYYRGPRYYAPRGYYEGYGRPARARPYYEYGEGW